LTYDYGASTVWVDDISASGEGDRWLLCANHAERLRAPVGWTHLDRRINFHPQARAAEATAIDVTAHEVVSAARGDEGGRAA
jgi:hypothetical protein